MSNTKPHVETPIQAYSWQCCRIQQGPFWLGLVKWVDKLQSVPLFFYIIGVGRLSVSTCLHQESTMQNVSKNLRSTFAANLVVALKSWTVSESSAEAVAELKW